MASTSNKHPRYYFGYGSNLDMKNFYIWCDENAYENVEMKVIGPAYATDYKLHFHYYSNGRKGGAADIIPTKTLGFAVPGVIFEPNEEGWLAIDQKEGHPAFYKREILNNIALLNLEQLDDDCASYFVTKNRRKDSFVKPTEHYAGLIRSGLAKYDLDQSMLTRSLRNWINCDLEAPNINHVFVYGTLRPGQHNEKYLYKENIVNHYQKARIQGILLSVNDMYPGLISSSNESDVVYGDLYEYEGNMQRAIEQLDSLESYEASSSIKKDNCEYIRVVSKIKLKENDTKTVFAWVYVYADDIKGLKQIKSGDWVTYHNKL